MIPFSLDYNSALTPALQRSRNPYLWTQD